MIEFSMNYSEAAAGLLRGGKIRLDRFKVPPWPQVIQTARQFAPVYVHFDFNAGGGSFGGADLATAEAMARDTATPYINLHLAPRAKDFPDHGQDAAAGGVIQAMLGDVNRAIDFFGPDRVIVENVPLGNPEEGFARAAVEPAVIEQIIDATGAGLLLDLSHARLTAMALGLDPRRYIQAMPLRNLRELHVTGLQIWQGRLRDHLHFSEQDWIETQWALDCIAAGDWPRPKIVAMEYGGVGGTFELRSDPAIMAEQVPRLYEMVKSASR